MDLRPSAIATLARSPGGKKMIRYSLVSVVAVAVSQVVLFITFGLVHMSARTSNIIAVCVSAVPSYYLNRTWAWGKSGRSHLWKEVLPFWALAFIGLAFSTWAADYAESHAKNLTDTRMLQTAIVMAAALGAFGILWVVKFVIFNKILFVHHTQDLEELPALDGRSGLPT